jgi:hypothetical protein
MYKHQNPIRADLEKVKEEQAKIEAKLDKVMGHMGIEAGIEEEAKE